MAVRLAGRGGFGLCTEDAARDPITSLGSPTAVHTREGGFRYVVFAKSFGERIGAPAASDRAGAGGGGARRDRRKRARSESEHRPPRSAAGREDPQEHGVLHDHSGGRSEERRV